MQGRVMLFAGMLPLLGFAAAHAAGQFSYLHKRQMLDFTMPCPCAGRRAISGACCWAARRSCSACCSSRSARCWSSPSSSPRPGGRQSAGGRLRRDLDERRGHGALTRLRPTCLPCWCSSRRRRFGSGGLFPRPFGGVSADGAARSADHGELVPAARFFGRHPEPDAVFAVPHRLCLPV